MADSKQDMECVFCGQPTPKPKKLTCAYCRGPAEGHYSIHRDGFCQGPQVPLCDECGSERFPTCDEIWARISTRLSCTRAKTGGKRG